MATITLEDRLAAVEHELGELKQRLDEVTPTSPAHRWEKIFGTFADSEGFDEAVRLGREYQMSLQPRDDEDSTNSYGSRVSESQQWI